MSPSVNLLSPNKPEPRFAKKGDKVDLEGSTWPCNASLMSQEPTSKAVKRQDNAQKGIAMQNYANVICAAADLKHFMDLVWAAKLR